MDQSNFLMVSGGLIIKDHFKVKSFLAPFDPSKDVFIIIIIGFNSKYFDFIFWINAFYSSKKAVSTLLQKQQSYILTSTYTKEYTATINFLTKN